MVETITVRPMDAESAHISPCDGQLRVRDGEFAWLARNGDYRVPSNQRTRSSESPGGPVGPEDYRVHHHSTLVTATDHHYR
jgi:hypothetical protein